MATAPTSTNTRTTMRIRTNTAIRMPTALPTRIRIATGMSMSMRRPGVRTNTRTAAKPRRRTRLVSVERDILARNDAIAAENRRALQAAKTLALNLVSSPGSGKTALLVETLKRIGDNYPVAVIEGDQETTADADRIRATGVPAIQINTGKGCHLDADHGAHRHGSGSARRRTASCSSRMSATSCVRPASISARRTRWSSCR